MYGTLIHVVCLLFSSLICLHLPSDSTSRWTPLMFSYIFPAVGQIRDFHPLECVHAGHTMLRLFQSRCAGFAFLFLLPCVFPSLASPQAALPPRKSPYLTSWSERSWRLQKGATPCGSIILTHREAELHNLPPCGSKIRNKPARFSYPVCLPKLNAITLVAFTPPNPAHRIDCRTAHTLGYGVAGPVAVLPHRRV